MDNFHITPYIDFDKLVSDLGLPNGDAIMLKGIVGRKVGSCVSEFLQSKGYSDAKVSHTASTAAALAEEFFRETKEFELPESLTASQIKVFKKPVNTSRYRPHLIQNTHTLVFGKECEQLYKVEHEDADVYFAAGQPYEPAFSIDGEETDIDSLLGYDKIAYSELLADLTALTKITSNKKYQAQPNYSVMPVDEDGFLRPEDYPIQQVEQGIPAGRWKTWSKALDVTTTDWYVCRDEEYWYCRSGSVLIAQKLVTSEEI